MVVETNLAGAGFEFAVPVRAFAFFSKSEVPLADDGGPVASFLHEVGQGESVSIDDEVSVRGRDSGSLLTEGVIAGEQGVAGGCACGGGTVSTGEELASGGEFIDVRCFESGRSVTGEIAVAQVVGHDDDDVGLRLC